MATRLEWHGDAAQRFVLKMTWEGLLRATVYFHQQVVNALNVSAKVGRGTKAKDYAASRPGEPPRKRTGWLQRNVVYEIDQQKQTTRVGVRQNAFYGLFLELGTSFMAARPFLVSTIRKSWQGMLAQLRAGGKAA